jgi:hypothetical protein
MEFYMPRDDSIEKLDKSYSDPAGLEVMQRVGELSEENGADPEIDNIFPVRSRCD